MTNLIVTTPIELEAMIFNSISKALTLQQQVSTIESRPAEETLITRIEAAGLLQVSLRTLGTWTIKGYVQSYRLNRRIYYKRNEILDSLKRRDFFLGGDG